MTVPAGGQERLRFSDNSFILDQHDPMFGSLMFFGALMYFSKSEAMHIESNHFQVIDLIQMP